MDELMQGWMGGGRSEKGLSPVSSDSAEKDREIESEI